jgi:apolipoprotein D and lipocalin family protein
MIIQKFCLPLLGIVLLITGCTGVPKGLSPVTEFDKERYLGTWYEIARLDHSFERNLTNVRADYSVGKKEEIRVENKGFDVKKNEWKRIEGRAKFISSPDIGSLKVSFFGPFYSGYHVIVLDEENYNYAMVTGPSRSYLWILSRNKDLDASIRADLISQAEAWGFDTKKLIIVDHNLPAE